MAKNQAVFGVCTREHGHNYLLEATVEGPVDADNGMVVNLYDLKEVIKDVLEEFDHKHLNLDTPYFSEQVPTPENFAWVLWRILNLRTEIGQLSLVKLSEDEDLWVEVSGEELTSSVTRRYRFSAAHEPVTEFEQTTALLSGHNYVLQVTVSGPVDPLTGMVTNLTALDGSVRERVLNRFDRRNLSQDTDLRARGGGGVALLSVVADELLKSVDGGVLSRLRLLESDDTFYEYVPTRIS
jgi:6-pyruvoyltetrahydropterin/6-carboxytetrahydropterin synthase